MSYTSIDLRVSKSWGHFHFWENYPENIYQKKKRKKIKYQISDQIKAVYQITYYFLQCICKYVLFWYTTVETMVHYV